MTNNTDLSSLSYTNKDFNSIYTELLEYAKKISYKWDPTASDESDPGVVLLKLVALIGDKNNYNIDKNILELMPATVSQLPAARQLFDQCGYTMHHYYAAESQLQVTMRRHPEGDDSDNEYVYKIPPFTMFTDADSSVVYTTKPNTSEMSLRQTYNVDVVQGTVVEYTINNDPLITLANLDSRNRIYFREHNIAENGIFINNVGVPDNFDDWKKVDNLVTQPRNIPCYKFGVTTDGSACYIEFPDTIDLLIGEGLNIRYITTSGSTGNVAANKIVKFFNDTKFERINSNTKESELVNVTSEHVHVTNAFPILNGYDPETIDEAYKNYKRVKDTFNTLVTVKDYTDYMVTTNEASNGFVTDRLNDIQHSYKIFEVDDLSNITSTVVETDEEGSASMTAFDLGIYALEFVGNPASDADFNRSFKLVTDTSNIQRAFAEAKSLQHDFIPLQPEKILLIKNKYKFNATIIPRYKLDNTEQESVKKQIKLTLFNALNSKQLNFGQEVPYELLYDLVNSADARIKAASVSYPEFETYVVYMDHTNELKEIRIDTASSVPSDPSLQNLYNKFRTEIFAKNVLSGITPLYKKDSKFLHTLKQNVTDYNIEATHVTTNTTLRPTVQQLTGEDYKYEYTYPELLKNESILVSCPSYVEESSYASYVKIIYNFAADIRANAKYKLGSADYIVFFYKSTDTQEYYDYVKYDNTSFANVISPSFSMKASQEDIETDLRNYAINLPAGKGTTSSDLYAKIKALTSTSSKALHVLTGTQVIKTLKKNQIQINENSSAGCKNLYWITNSIVKVGGKDYCQLVFNAKNEYTLKSGEYLLYTNDSKTSLNILGEGTLITKGSDLWEDSDPTVPAIAYEEFLINGSQFIQWEIIPLSSNPKTALTATEMQQELLGPGCTLNIKSKGSIPDNSLSSSITKLSNVSISYDDGLNSIIQLEGLFTDDPWRVQTFLNLEVSSDSPQKFVTDSVRKQEITLINKKLTGETEKPIVPDAGTEIYLLSDKFIHILGGSDVDITFYNVQEDVFEPTSFLVYQNVAYTSGGNVQLDFTSDVLKIVCSNVSDTSNKTIQLPSVRIPEGKYLLNIKTLYDCVSSLSVTDSTGNKVKPMYKEPQINTLYTIDSDGENDVTLQISFQPASDTVVLFVQPLFKYTKDNLVEAFNDETYDDTSLLKLLNDLDINKMFDYTYIHSDHIDNPLDAREFHNKNHFYNKYTIDEWRTDSMSNIRITSNIK